MGAGSSTSHGGASPSSLELQAEESLAASTGALPSLRAAFSNLSTSSSSVPSPSLQDAFGLKSRFVMSDSSPVREHFSKILHHIGPTIAEIFFMPGKEGIDWLNFLKGYNRCCARMPVTTSMNSLYKLYEIVGSKSGSSTELVFDDSDPENGKIGGLMSSRDLLMFLCVCWVLDSCSGDRNLENGDLTVPDLNHLVMSALISSGEIREDDDAVWECDVFGLEKKVEAQKLHMWVLSTVPGLAQCLSQYVRGKIQAIAASKHGQVDDSSGSSVGNSSSAAASNTYLLTCGRAWAISLTRRNSWNEEISSLCFQKLGTDVSDKLLYRSSVHGKGLTRFWSNIEGYHGPILTLVSARSADKPQNDSTVKSWVIGVLTEDGYENRDAFFGTSAYLYAISPYFHVISSSGKEKNFVYCHLHPAIKIYQPNPKPTGLGFGGAIGNERIFIDEDFAKVTIRHHAVDKTFQSGSLIPAQGYLPVEASIVEVEAWGLGAQTVKQRQDMYKRREAIFSEQRRKVDLKTFGSWEDSPEKAMMDMVSDPNRVRREDR